MSDKRGTWSKEARKKVWKDYTRNKVNHLYKREYLARFELSVEAPCPFCGKLMLKAQYQGFQPNHDYSWDIDHVDSNPENNYLINLQPIHPWCNKEKN